MSMLQKTPGRTIAAALVLGAGALLYGACSSTAKGVDACRSLESARCEMLAAATCNTDGSFKGDAASCARFYDTQCGRGLQDGASEPTSEQLKQCVAAIKGSCAIAREPTNAPECARFLTPPVTPAIDAGTDTTPADTAPATDATDGATD